MAPSFPSLYFPCRVCPEPPEHANARASSWLHPKLAPLSLSLSSWHPTPPPGAPKTTPRSLPLPPEPFPRPPVRRVHGEPRVGYLRPPPSPLSTPLALSPSRAFPGPTHCSSRALLAPPWQDQCRRPPLKFVGLDPSLFPMNTPAPSHHHRQLTLCSISSSSCLPRRVEPRHRLFLPRPRTRSLWRSPAETGSPGGCGPSSRARRSPGGRRRWTEPPEQAPASARPRLLCLHHRGREEGDDPAGGPAGQ